MTASSNSPDGQPTPAENSKSSITAPIPSVPVAIVTGAARRIGREIALSLARRGLGVVVHYGTSRVEADSVVQQILSEGGRAIAVSADLREPQRAAVTVLEVADELGSPAVLINSAAVFHDCDLSEIDMPHCSLHTNVNWLAPVFMTQQFVKRLGKAESAHIINILDWRGLRPGETHLIYTATKAAMVCITRSLAQQLAPRIYVNGIAPGAILPPDDRSDWHQQRAIEAIPLKKTGSPQDICAAINFLLDSTFVTGEILHVSGGEEL